MQVSLAMSDADAREAARAALRRHHDAEIEIESDARVIRLDEEGAEYVVVEVWVYLPVERGE